MLIFLFEKKVVDQIQKWIYLYEYRRMDNPSKCLSKPLDNIFYLQSINKSGT